MRPDLLQTHRLDPHCEAGLAERFTVHKLHEAADRDALLARLAPSLRAIAGGGVNAALIEKLPALEIIANFGVGYDSIDTAAASAHGVVVTNTPDVLNDAVAEMTIGLMIALARRIPQGDRFIREGRWLKGSFPLQSELNGKTLGIIGLGRIGREIAQRAQAMKMRVVYFGRRRQPNQPFIYYDNLVEMARDSDWLLVMAPGGKATEKLVSRTVLEALGPEGFLVNMARGSLVDQSALVERLAAGQLAGAALDVFEDEPNVPEILIGLDNVVLSPHVGSATRQTRTAMGDLVIANLDAHFAGTPHPSRVV